MLYYLLLICARGFIPHDVVQTAAATTAPTPDLADLQAQQQAAVAREDYVAAAQLKKQIDAVGTVTLRIRLQAELSRF